MTTKRGNMPSLSQIGEHLGMSKQNAARLVKKLGIDAWYSELSLDTIRYLYIERLRKLISENETYTAVRARRMEVENQLLQLKIDKLAATLVDLNELLPIMAEVLQEGKKIVARRLVMLQQQLEQEYHIQVPIELLEEESKDVFSDMEAYLRSHNVPLDG